MEQHIENSIFVNTNIIGIFVISTVIGAVVILGILYYLLVNRKNIFLYVSLFLLSSFTRFFSFTIIYLTATMGSLVSYRVEVFQWLIPASSIFTLFITRIIIGYFFEKKSLLHDFFSGVLMVAMVFVGGNYWNTQTMMAIYTYIVYGSYVAFMVLAIHDDMGLREMSKGHVTLIVNLIGTIVAITYNYYYATLNNSEWIITTFLIVYLGYAFIKNYKQVYDFKESMYQKLIYDPILKCYSKNYFIEKYEETTTGVIIFMDFNAFKWVNDLYGHLVGDSLIKAFTVGINDRLKPYMTLGRFGGDEFVVLMRSNNVDEAYDFSMACIEVFEEAVMSLNLPEGNSRLGVSVGLSPFDKTSDFDALYKADMAMYASKSKGNNQITLMEG